MRSCENVWAASVSQLSLRAKTTSVSRVSVLNVPWAQTLTVHFLICERVGGGFVDGYVGLIANDIVSHRCRMSALEPGKAVPMADCLRAAMVRGMSADGCVKFEWLSLIFFL